MAGIRWPPEDPEMFPTRMLRTGVWGPTGPAGPAGGPPGEMASDDDRSVAADSWSIKSDYGSTLDDEQRYADTAEVLLASSCPFSGSASAAAPSSCSSSSLSARHSSDFSFDKDVLDVVPPMLGLQNYHDGTYAEDLANYHERSHADDWTLRHMLALMQSRSGKSFYIYNYNATGREMRKLQVDEDKREQAWILS